MQIAVRPAELDSLLMPRSVSVIVRSSTSDPEATCEAKLKLVENDLNNLPMGFSHGRDADNTLLKLATPNMMRLGSLNSRAVDGPIRFPTGPKDVMVDELSKKVANDKKVEPTRLVQGSDGTYRVKDARATVAMKKTCDYCCESHCMLSVHNLSRCLVGVNLAKSMDSVFDMGEYEFPHIYERDLSNELDDEHIKSGLVMDAKDEIYNIITALETNFSLE